MFGKKKFSKEFEVTMVNSDGTPLDSWGCVTQYKDDQLGIKSIVADLDEAQGMVRINYCHSKLNEYLRKYEVGGVTVTGFRIQQGLLTGELGLREFNRDEGEIIYGLDHPKLVSILLSNGVVYGDETCAKVLEDIKNPHKAMVVKGTKDPYYFNIGGVIFESDTNNYFKFLADRIPIQDWMLTMSKAKAGDKDVCESTD